MSGHSKWANIKRKKEANDKVRGALFSKLSRLITLSVIEGGGMTDPANNFKLRLMIDKAKAQNMPKENIERAIEKGSGPDSQSLKEVVFEAFAPHGVALLISCTTDNPNRTFVEVRMCLERNGGKMGNQGSVSYLFTRCSVAVFSSVGSVGESAVLTFADGVQAFDMQQTEDGYTVYFPLNQFKAANDHLGSLTIQSLEVAYKPQMAVTIEDRGAAESVIRLIEALEELDDVQSVYSNLS